MTLEEHPGTWTYDPEAGAAYIYLRGPIAPGGVARTVTGTARWSTSTWTRTAE